MEICGWHRRRIQELPGVLSVWLGTADLRWAKLCIARGQDGIEHDPATLLVRALTILHAFALPGLHSTTPARFTDHAHETLRISSYY